MNFGKVPSTESRHLVAPSCGKFPASVMPPQTHQDILMLQSSALFASLNSPNVCASFSALERRPKPLRGKCYRQQTWIELSSVNLSGFIRLREIHGRDWPNKLRHQIIRNWIMNWILAGICGRVAHALACNKFDRKHKNSKKITQLNLKPSMKCNTLCSQDLEKWCNLHRLGARTWRNEAPSKAFPNCHNQCTGKTSSSSVNWEPGQLF